MHSHILCFLFLAQNLYFIVSYNLLLLLNIEQLDKSKLISQEDKEKLHSLEGEPFLLYIALYAYYMKNWHSLQKSNN